MNGKKFLSLQKKHFMVFLVNLNEIKYMNANLYLAN